MSDHRDGICCRIDPAQAERLPDGRVCQEVSVVMTDDHRFDGRRGRQWLPPAVCTLTPTEAREMAFELLSAAEHAERAGERL